MASLISRNVSRILPRVVRVAGRIPGGSPSLVYCQSLPLAIVSSQRHLCSQDHEKVAVETEVATDGVWVKEPQIKRKQEERLDKILYSLDLSIRKSGRIQMNQVISVFNLIQSLRFCSESQAVLLLKCCGEVLVDEDRQVRTKLLEKCLRLLMKIDGLSLDISHYNTVLKVHLENDNPVNISEFLATLDRKEIAPNRVTFQHIVALYCQAGDIAGATTILQHMKENNMAINESVLLSLLSAHCANNDQDGVTSTLDVLTSSGINIDVDVYTTMATSYARSGNWEKVEEIFEEAATYGTSFEDSDIFSIIQACTRGGLLKESFSLIEKFPRKRGYFQEMRLAVPQLALDGNIPVVMKLSLTQKDRPGFDKTNQGMFLASSITRSGASPAQIVPAMLDLETFGYLRSFQNMFHEAAFYFSEEKCEEFRQEVEKIKGDEKPILDLEHTFKYLRFRLEQEDDPKTILKCIHNLTVMKVQVPFDILAYDIMPRMLDKSYFQPRTTAIDIARALPNLSYSMICNCMLQSLLNQQTQQNFNAAVGFFLYSNIVQVLPFKWSSSLARAYLHTRDVENMITIIYCAIKKAKQTDRKDPDLSYKQLFNSLVHIEKQAHLVAPGVPSDQLIVPVLKDLIKHKIGFPGHVESHSFLQESLKSDEARDLLSEASRVWEDRANYWTQKNEDIFHQQRIDLFLMKMKRSNSQSSNVTNITDERGEKTEGVSFKTSDRQIHQCLEEGDVDQAAEIIKQSRKNRRSFVLSPTTLDAMVDGYLKQNKVMDAKDVIFTELSMASQRKVKSITLMKWLAAVARAEDHVEVMETLANIDPSRVLGKEGKHLNLLQNVYVERKDFEKLKEVTDSLIYNKFADPSSSDHLAPIVDFFLDNNDTAGALFEFIKLANLHHKLPKKFSLTCRLIEEGNVEGVKKVSELASKYSQSRFKAEYDLAHCYLQLGKKSEAKQIFDEPGMRYEEGHFDYIYRQLEAHNPEACQDMVGVTRNLYGLDRDNLYQKLAKTYRMNPDKVEEIWLQVQEEGIVPSVDLKVVIGDILESHGRSVPFLKPERAVKENVKIATADPEVYNAIKNNENIEALNIVLDGYKARTTSLKCKKHLLDHLIKQNDLKRASVLAAKIANSFQDPEKKITFRHFYYSLMSVLGEKERETFLRSLPKKFAAVLKDHQKPQKSSDAALDAFHSKDRETLSKLVSHGKVSRNMLRRILSMLLEDNRLDEASEIALIVSKDDDDRNIDTIVLHMRILMSKWEECGEVEKIKKFLTNLDSRCSSKIRGDVILRNVLIKSDPDSYLELLKEDQKYIVSHDILEESIANQPGLLKKIAASAESGNVLANVLLAKHNLSLGNKDEFSKFYRLCPSDLIPVKLFDHIDTEEKFNISLDEASGNKAFLEQIVNNYLRKNLEDPENFTRISNVAIDRGMELNGFATSFRKKLSKSSDFTLQKEALASLV